MGIDIINLAKQIAIALLSDLKSGRLKRIGATEVNARCDIVSKQYKLTSIEKEQLTQTAFRQVVERA